MDTEHAQEALQAFAEYARYMEIAARGTGEPCEPVLVLFSDGSGHIENILTHKGMFSEGFSSLANLVEQFRVR